MLAMFLKAITALVFVVSTGPTTADFQYEAAKRGINPTVLAGICHYESDFGRVKVNKNKNGTWDVGYCQNNTKRLRYVPKVPSDQVSVQKAAKELRYWKRQHNRFCVHLRKRTGKCGKMMYGDWVGIKNCKRPHPWWAHYNWGFRVVRNNYGRRIQCFINSGFKRCSRKKWRRVSFR